MKKLMVFLAIFLMASVLGCGDTQVVENGDVDDVAQDGDEPVDETVEDGDIVDETVEDGDIEEPVCSSSPDCPSGQPFCVGGQCLECVSNTDCPPEDTNIWTEEACFSGACEVRLTCNGIRFVPSNGAFRCRGLDLDLKQIKVWNNPPPGEWIYAGDGICHVYCSKNTSVGDVPPEMCSGIYPSPFEGHYSCSVGIIGYHGVCSARSEECVLLE